MALRSSQAFNAMLIIFALLLGSGDQASSQSSLPSCSTGPTHSFHKCYGLFTSANGDTYTGEFEHGVPHGVGTLKFSSGEEYTGDFVASIPHGRGTLRFPTGEQYVGDFIDAAPSGYGFLSLPSGEKYVGEFKDAKYHGLGTLYNADGSIKSSGKWENGATVGDGTRGLLAR